MKQRSIFHTASIYDAAIYGFCFWRRLRHQACATSHGSPPGGAAFAEAPDIPENLRPATPIILRRFGCGHLRPLRIGDEDGFFDPFVKARMSRKGI
jgi:hypothetical protein